MFSVLFNINNKQIQKYISRHVLKLSKTEKKKMYSIYFKCILIVMFKKIERPQDISEVTFEDSSSSTKYTTNSS